MTRKAGDATFYFGLAPTASSNSAPEVRVVSRGLAEEAGRVWADFD
jgi:hypothetical protein